MPFDEDDFMMGSSSSSSGDESTQDAEPENTYQLEEVAYQEPEAGSSREDADNKMMEYLLKGYALSTSTCNKCETPLIKSMMQPDAEEQPKQESRGWFGGGQEKKHPPGEPVKGVSFCVSCECVVVASKPELQIMWKNENKHLMGMNGVVELQIDEDFHASPVDEGPVAYTKSDVTEEVDDASDHRPITYKETGNGLLIARNSDESSQNTDGKDSHSEATGQSSGTSQESRSSQASGTSEASRVHYQASAPEEATGWGNAGEVCSVVSGQVDGGASRGSGSVDGSANDATSVVADNGNIEVAFSDEVKEEKKEEPINVEVIEYSKRRQIATKVLGAKMIKGFSLKDTQCDTCAMPMMESPEGHVLCVVCPVLEKKILKKRAEAAAAEEARRAEEERQKAEAIAAEQRRKAEAAAAEAEAKRQAERAAQKELLRAEILAEEEEKRRQMELQKQADEERMQQSLRNFRQDESSFQQSLVSPRGEEDDYLLSPRSSHRDDDSHLRSPRSPHRDDDDHLRSPRSSHREDVSVSRVDDDVSVARKQTLKQQLEEERRLFAELQRARLEAGDIDEEEFRIQEEIRQAKERRAKEEERLRRLKEEKMAREKAAAAREQRLAREQEEERLRLIEELRIAKLQREAEETAEQEIEKSQKAKDEEERKRLVEELRIARAERASEQRRRKEEALMAKKKEELTAKALKEKQAQMREKEEELQRLMDQREEDLKAQEEDYMNHLKAREEDFKAKEEDYQRNLKAKEEERQRMAENFESIQRAQRDDAARRQKELEFYERKAVHTERQLDSWKQMAENERAVAEQMRLQAEEKLAESEDALVEAEELAIEANNAKKSGYGDRQRLIVMYRKAEELRMAAEADEAAAKQQLAEAKRRLENSERMSRVTEQKLEKEKAFARNELEATRQKYTEEARDGRERLRMAEDQMLKARFGEEYDVADAGDDWDARRLLGKKVLAKLVMSGWTVLPEYCKGRMCNFNPLVGKGSSVKCVVCDGCGDGRDGAYAEYAIDVDDTMSFVSRRNRFSNIPSANGNHQHGSRKNAMSKEVGRRILEGWVLSEKPCPTCQMPLLSEGYGGPELCVQCNGDCDFEEDDYDENVRDDVSVSSRQSITLDIPDGFDPSDPNAMAALVARATSSLNRPGSVSRSRAPPRNRIPSSIGGSDRPMSRGRERPMSRGRVPRSRSVSQQRLHPESRNALPTGSSGRVSRNRTPSRPRRLPEQRQPSSTLYIPSSGMEEDDASQLSDDVSVAKSVASHTMDAIMSKIKDCRAQLDAPVDDGDDASVAQRSEAADLMQKLAAAANAVRQLEASAE